MSVLQNRFHFLKFKFYFSIIFIIFNIYLINSALNILENFRIEFVVFICLSIINFLLSLNSKSTFFFKFFTFYSWLGYSFFYLIHIIYFNYNFTFGIGDFNFKNQSHIKELYNLLIIINLAIFVSFFLNKILNINYKQQSVKKYSFNINKNYILTIILAIILNIYIFNYYYHFFDYYFFYKFPNNFYLDSFLKWFFLFGFSSLICIFLNANMPHKFFPNFFFISAIQEFLFYFSILSRGSIFNSMAIYFAAIAKFYSNNKLSNKNLITFFLTIFILFFLNFYFLIDSRSSSSNHFNNFRKKTDLIEKHIETSSSNLKIVIKNEYKTQNNNINNIIDNSNIEKKNFYKIFNYNIQSFFLIIKNRIFGIDSLMVIVAYKNKSFDFLKENLFEKFDPGKTSYFDALRFDQQKLTQTNNLTLPALYGFLYYSGSYIFVFFLIIIIIFLCNFLEKINILLNNNIFLSSLLGQQLAYRLWHFGYAPNNSWKFFLSIILTIFIVYFFKFFLIKCKILKI